MNDAQKVEFHKDIPYDKLKGCIFTHYGYHDPAGLCDGGDYLYNVQIRIENAQGDVYISVQPKERSEWLSGTMTWKEFHDMLYAAASGNPKIKCHN